MSHKVNVGAVTSFPLNQTKSVEAISENGQTINACIARWADGFYAFHDSCTHAHAPLGECDIEDGQISCPLHGARFSITDGKALTLPAVKPLIMYPVSVEDGEVYLVV